MAWQLSGGWGRLHSISECLALSLGCRSQCQHPANACSGRHQVTAQVVGYLPHVQSDLLPGSCRTSPTLVAVGLGGVS